MKNKLVRFFITSIILPSFLMTTVGESTLIANAESLEDDESSSQRRSENVSDLDEGNDIFESEELDGQDEVGENENVDKDEEENPAPNSDLENDEIIEEAEENTVFLDDAGATTTVSDEEALLAALSSGGTVKLLNDISCSKSILEIKNKSVTLDLNGHVLEHSGSTGFISVLNDFHLTGNGTLGYAVNVNRDNSAGGDVIFDMINGTLTKYITGQSCHVAISDGIVQGYISLTDNCELHISGGIVEKNVTVANNSFAGIEGGVLKDYVKVSNGEFTMMSGQVESRIDISNSKVTILNGKIDGDARIHDGSIGDIQNGEIGGTIALYKANESSGDTEIQLSGGKVNNVIVRDGSYFTMTGGKIESSTNNAVNLSGNSSFLLTDGTITGSSSNAVTIGNSCSFFMQGGKISGNKGIGVSLASANAAFEMTGGQITDNTCGVFLNGDSSVFAMSGKCIIENNNRREGPVDGGVWVSNGCLNMSGTPIIRNNYQYNGEPRDLFFMAGSSKVINITGKLESEASVGVFMHEEGVFTNNYSIYNVANTNANTFYSNIDKYHTEYSAAIGEMVLVKTGTSANSTSTSAVNQTIDNSNVNSSSSVSSSNVKKSSGKKTSTKKNKSNKKTGSSKKSSTKKKSTKKSGAKKSTKKSSTKKKSSKKKSSKKK